MEILMTTTQKINHSEIIKKCVNRCMTPMRLMECFVNILEESKISVNELELAFLSELNINRLIKKECIVYRENEPRVFQAWINKIDHVLIKKDDFIEDLTFVALELESIGTSNLTIHNFVEYVLAPKLNLFFGDSKKIHDEIITKVESKLTKLAAV
jgi:hypothetical protein